MAEYDAVIEAAEAEASNGQYKDAYNTLGRALLIGGPADRECRYRRGLYALRVGHARLDQFEESGQPSQTLIKAGCWLSRSEAYLTSASEGASGPELERIADDLESMKQEQDRFRQLCRDSGLDLFTPGDDSMHDE